MILSIFFVIGFIQSVSSIQCYTCTDPGNFCIVPLSIDGDGEQNENDIGSYNYDSDYVCESDRYIDIRGIEKIILRGTQHCKEVDDVNHRRYCCKTDNCNQNLPPMKREFFITASNQQYLPSMILIIIAFIFQYYFY